ncbi:MAG: MotA/TolQ/ExbB proton channel family protein [Planctomycetota bacterium]|nr:MotA/TolQ/ExbB proton channel family protein [Planctomycetota bacterium]
MTLTRKPICVFLALALFALPGMLAAQPPAGGAASDEEVAAEIQEAFANEPADAAQEAGDEDADVVAKQGSDEGKLNLLTLLLAGGWPMIPIVFMLILVVTFVIDRLLGLRRLKVMPPELTTEFGRLATGAGGFDPRKAYRICQQYPCTASNVIRAMLLKIGRPHAEVEHSVNEANEREAAGLYANVRWLNLAAAVTPLMGLFGTVWGMINAFYATATLPEGASKAQVLADGIVIALVTTLGGLFVAIPAAIAAHFFEGRIQALFREIDELLFSLLPQIERFEGKLRVSREHLDTSSPAVPPTGDGEVAGEKQETPAASNAPGAKKPDAKKPGAKKPSEPAAPPIQHPAEA